MNEIETMDSTRWIKDNVTGVPMVIDSWFVDMLGDEHVVTLFGDNTVRINGIYKRQDSAKWYVDFKLCPPESEKYHWAYIDHRRTWSSHSHTQHGVATLPDVVQQTIIVYLMETANEQR